MKKVSFCTLGCKLNQAETAILAELFEQNGYQLLPFGEHVDICVINTCTVTSKSDYRCRQMIRKAKKISPSAKIAVVGCYAQLFPEKIQTIKGVDIILGSDKKFDLLDVLDENASINAMLSLRSPNDVFLNPRPGNFWNHTRAFLKIQDGCDNYCSYCTVPLARGRSRSDSLHHIVESANELVQRGHKEIVLTGVHIGHYGKDLIPVQTLLDVLKEMESVEGLNRIRLSSLEPLEIDDALLHWIAVSNKICHHFHVPMQSGDDDILKMMNRNYSAKDFVGVIEAIKKILPDSGLGTDIIVGFPGESEERFQNTVQLIKQLPFTYLHVFSFSPRTGTKATRFPDRVNQEKVRQRSEILRTLGKAKKKSFYANLVGKELNVLWEDKDCGDWMFGFSGNYARVRSKANPQFVNKICNVEIAKAEQDFVHGNIIES